MAVTSGTFTKYDAKGLREQLSNAIYRITPEKTPFLSLAGRGEKADQTLVEWQTDALAAVDGSNAQIEGDETSYTTPAATVRVGNYTQISSKSLVVSDTLEEVSKAGRKSEVSMQMMKRAAELKRDQETILLRAQGGAAGSSSVARTLASMNAWIKTNVDKEGTGANPVYTSGVPSAARTDGATRAFTETIAKNVIQLCYTAGAEPSIISVGPVNKQRFSTFSGIATRNLNQTSAGTTAVIGAADVYVSDFGELRVIPNRFQRERDAWFIDPDMVSVRYLRDYRTKDLAINGDQAAKKLLVCEYTLEVRNEAGFGLAADLQTT